MPIYVLLVGCNEIICDTAAQLIRQLTHHVVALPDLSSAINALAGIKFDILVTGDIALDPHVAGFLSAAKALQPDLQVIDSKTIPRSGRDDGSVRFGKAPFTLDELRSAFQIGMTPEHSPIY